MAVVTVKSPGLQHAICVPVLAGPPHVIHGFIAAAFDNGSPDPSGDIFECFVPRHLLPSAISPFTSAPQRVQDPVRILELVRCDHALGASPPAAARMDGVAFDLADFECLL